MINVEGTEPQIVVFANINVSTVSITFPSSEDHTQCNVFFQYISSQDGKKKT